MHDDIDTTITPETFETTEMRGLPLLQHVLSIIEREADALDVDELETHAGLWDQSTWGDIARSDRFHEIVATQKPNSSGVVTVELAPENAIECGTSFCFAGHTVLRAGDRPLFTFNQDYPGTAKMFDVVTSDDKRRMHVSTRAAELLELDATTADILFDAENNLDDIREIVRRVETGENVHRCADCDEPVWRCAEGAHTCATCYLHSVDCECCDHCQSLAEDCECDD